LLPIHFGAVLEPGRRPADVEHGLGHPGDSFIQIGREHPPSGSVRPPFPVIRHLDEQRRYATPRQTIRDHLRKRKISAQDMQHDHSRKRPNAIGLKILGMHGVVDFDIRFHGRGKPHLENPHRAAGAFKLRFKGKLVRGLLIPFGHRLLVLGGRERRLTRFRHLHKPLWFQLIGDAKRRADHH
jgi:hypothetical protein